MSDLAPAPAPALPGDTAEAEGSSVVAIIRGLQDGSIKGSALSVSDRQACVEHLMNEGYTTPETAAILKVSDRTVARDRKAVRQSHAVQRDPKLVEQIVGRLLHEAEGCVSRMRRVARDKTTPAAVKVEAEHRSWQILSDLTGRLQSLGYLPTAAQQIQAELTHHTAELPEVEELGQEVERLLQLSQSAADPTALAQLQSAQQTVLRIGVSKQLDDLKLKLQQEQHHEPIKP